MPTNFGNKKIIFIAISILIIFALIGTGVFIGKNFNRDKQSAQPVQEEIKTILTKLFRHLHNQQKNLLHHLALNGFKILTQEFI